MRQVLLQVGAYAFACQRGTWPFHYSAICLLPVMDMLNHRAGNVSNAIVDQNKNGSYSCYAKRAIQAGEEVCVAAFPEAHTDLQRLLDVNSFQTSQGQIALCMAS